MVGNKAEEGLQGLESVLSTLKELDADRNRIRSLPKEGSYGAKGRRSWQAARAVVHVGGLAK